jgi:hypothetical protein
MILSPFNFSVKMSPWKREVILAPIVAKMVMVSVLAGRIEAILWKLDHLSWWAITNPELD